MTRDEFDALVSRVERRFGRRPLLLRLCIIYYVALGYLVFVVSFGLIMLLGLGMLAMATFMDVAGAALFVAIPGAALLTFGLIQAAQVLWISLDEPKGRVLQPAEAPELFALLSRLRKAARAPAFHRIVLTVDFNAGVVEYPRLGVFGWPRHTLLLGLPLLDALALREVEAVLAHEIGHLSARHGRFLTWIYRLRRTWEKLFEQFQQPPRSQTAAWLRSGLSWFIGWYWPRFNAHALVLSRADEYQADRDSAEWAGVDYAVAALWRVECLTRRWLEEVSPALWDLAQESPEPPNHFTELILQRMRASPEADAAARWIDQAICNLTDNADTHPSFSDRVSALGADPEARRAAAFPSVASPSAATELLGANLPDLRRELEASWREQLRDTWRRRHGRVASLKRQIAAIAVPDAGMVNPDVLWERACAILDMQGPEAAEPLLRQLVEIRPRHSAANLILGQHLLKQDLTSGVELLMRILAEEDDELIPQACAALAQQFRALGDTERVADIHRRLSEYEAAAEAARVERSNVSASDRFIPHELADAELAALGETLAAIPGLTEAYLARKELRHFPRRRLFVLCVRSRVGFLGRSNALLDESVARRATPKIKLPGRVLVVSPGGVFASLARKITKQPNSRVPLPATLPVSPEN